MNERHYCTDYELCEECHLCDGCCTCAPKRQGTYDTGEWDRWVAAREAAGTADDTPGRVASTLAAIRRRFSNTNYATTTDSPRLLSVAMASAADVPFLLAAVEAALKLTEPTGEVHRDLDGNEEGGVVRVVRCDELREAITAALTGEGESDGQQQG